MDPLRPSTLRPAPRVDRCHRPTYPTPPHLRLRLVLLGLVVLAAALLVPPAALRAAGVVGDGTPASCTEAAFTSALDGGSLVTFNCGPAPHAIVLTSEKLPAQDIAIDGGGRITLSGGNSTPLLYVLGGTTMELRRLTISNGFNAGRDGGAIRNDGTLRLIDTVFRDNQTSPEWSGGAIVSFGTLEITNSTFDNNRGGNAGAIYPVASARTTIVGSVFRNNQTSTANIRGWGGALLLWDSAVVTVRDSQFIANRASFGGAFYVHATSVLDIDGGAVRDNVASSGRGGDGGGIYNTGQLRLGNVQVSGNSAVNEFSNGGGISNRVGAVATISGGAISSNRTGFSGAVVNSGRLTIDGVAVADNQAAVAINSSGAQSTLRVSNTTISGHQGGGVWAVGDTTTTLANVTIANNGGNGLLVDDSTIARLALVNVLLAGNSGPNCSGVSVTKPISSQFGMSDDGSCSWTGNGNRHSTDAKLAPLADNGGATLTHLPQAGSPAIDGGTGSGCPATDQRGVVRPQGASCDIGAVEIGLPPAAPPSPSPSASPAPVTFRALVPLVQR